MSACAPSCAGPGVGETPAVRRIRIRAATRLIGRPLVLSFDGERALYPSAPPAVGEHTAEILGELGYEPDEIAALAAEGVIRR